ncbi:hypothetical protein CDD81_602 [Ophiocordyceps australis]|uniref:Phosphatidylinositol-specific phospholipase C X domain-containing protein n=1 Tax=Ophiocordyceps australis TaxID=1399860 RepID=A0A2C5YBJ0_9HYPO|nr:hypothetical protein CDD81_602 [Ophiocordyceps australis]
MGATDEAERLLSPSADAFASISPAAATASCSPPRSSKPKRLTTLIAVTMISTLVIALWLLVFLAQTHGSASYHGYRSVFSFDSAADIPAYSAWQAQLDDTTPLAALSLPGTHDTMTYAMDTDQLQCQNEALATQLRAGLRYFDIRLRIRLDGANGPELCVYHANGFTGFCFDQVLREMAAFLVDEPSEALVVRVKQEGSPVGGSADASSAPSFEGLLQRSIAKEEVAPHIYSAKLAPGLGRGNASFPIPTLGALRSRILMLQDFPAAAGPATYGPAWDGPQMALEDDWITMDLFHLADKWVAIRNALVSAAMAMAGSNTSSRLFVAHISASVGVLPIAAAAGPKELDITGLNDMTGQYLDYFGSFADVRGVGIVIFDFPGRKAIRAVIDMNKAPEKRCSLSKTPNCGRNILELAAAN